MVPNAAYDSFMANASWSAYNIVKAATSAVGEVEAAAEALPVAVYDLAGRRVATMTPAEAAAKLRPGVYVVGGRKVYVK